MLTRLSIRTVDGVLVSNLFARHAQGVGIEPNSAGHEEWIVNSWQWKRS
jgi:hypothetical protein